MASEDQSVEDRTEPVGVDVDAVDFFTDSTLVTDPYRYFDALRTQCPVHHIAHPGVVAVTGYEAAIEVYRDAATYSSCNSVGGPFPPVISPSPEVTDITDVIDRSRDQWPFSEFMVTMDGENHEAQRNLLRKLLTPRRLKENEAALAGIADRCIDAFIGTGRCEVVNEYGKPFTTWAIADLLGVPEEDRAEVQQVLVGSTISVVGQEETLPVNPLEFLYQKFGEYVEDRRANPRDDILTHLASATYEDGSLPEVDAIVRTATFLFGAGQDTSARMIAAALRFIAEDKQIQQRLREDRGLIPEFIEEVLRLESPTMSDFRLARVATTLGGVDIAAGTTVMIHPGAANRDDGRFERPTECLLGRENVREHIAFGRGAHSCPGGPLARAEGRVTVERFLDRTSDISISESRHGPEGQRHFDYDPTFIVRGLGNLHLELTPVD
ncbi:cytochrome P450 [Mycobacterium sp. Y57]|uniref:cytochrome P450 n=1 Tax=Mycolicibacterium xanthum TaxID=2796469 RepID=UPI001C858695|nr:cytochrome P450 [Mycolicibacterium xanthum]MBX7435433.1 cytochrome P450 [Mycolicibacterium xanthum]